MRTRRPGLTGSIILTAGETNRTVDAGVYCPAKLGDRIWLDNNPRTATRTAPEASIRTIPGRSSRAMVSAVTTSPRSLTLPVTVSLTNCADDNALDIAGDPRQPDHDQHRTVSVQQPEAWRELLRPVHPA